MVVSVRLCTLVFISLMLAPPVAADQFDGLYWWNFGRWEGTQTGWSCKKADIGMDGGAFAVQGTTYHSIEESCELSNPVRVRGLDAVLYDAERRDHAETKSERLMLMKHNSGIYVIRDGFALELQLCGSQ